MSRVAEIVEGTLFVVVGIAYAAIVLPLNLVSAGIGAILPREPYEGNDTYGFKDKDFIRMHFPDNETAIEEGQLAWVDFLQEGRTIDGVPVVGERISLHPVSKELIAKWPQGAWSVYDTGRLEHCKLATKNDNVEIREWLYDTYKDEYAERYYRTWLNRLGRVNVTA